VCVRARVGVCGSGRRCERVRVRASVGVCVRACAYACECGCVRASVCVCVPKKCHDVYDGVLWCIGVLWNVTVLQGLQ